MGDLFERAMKRHESNAEDVKNSHAKGAKHQQPEQMSSHDWTLDFNQLRESGYLTPDRLESRLSEEYRVIKRLLLVSAFGRGAPRIERGNAVVVTSALEGEGKTFTALNLAMSIAQERDSTVLLIDADLTRGSMSRLLRAEGSKGLTDLLTTSDLDPGNVIGKTNVEKLRFIPSGSVRDNAPELLASDQMEHLITELVTRYEDRVILFDSPPLLATSQAVVLSQLVGQVLMVVEDGRTTHSAVRDAIAQFDSNKLVGMVLNRCRPQKGSYYGSYQSKNRGAEVL